MSSVGPLHHPIIQGRGECSRGWRGGGRKWGRRCQGRRNCDSGDPCVDASAGEKEQHAGERHQQPHGEVLASWDEKVWFAGLLREIEVRIIGYKGLEPRDVKSFLIIIRNSNQWPLEDSWYSDYEVTFSLNLSSEWKYVLGVILSCCEVYRSISYSWRVLRGRIPSQIK